MMQILPYQETVTKQDRFQLKPLPTPTMLECTMNRQHLELL